MILRQRGNARGGGALGMLLVVGVMGVFLPLQMGRAWIESPMSLAYWAWVPIFLVTSVIADSIAGERERHTLETLLASRLPDSAIFFGKVLAGIGYGWGMSLAMLLTGLVTVNVVNWNGTPLLYTPFAATAGVALSLLTAGLAGSGGVLVSLRAATVRQAQQTLSLATIILLFVPMFGLQLLPPELMSVIRQAVESIDATGALAAFIATLAVLDVGLLAIGRMRFQRSRLILD